MEKLIEVFMESPEAGFALLKGMVEKYKPMVYDVPKLLWIFIKILQTTPNIRQQ